MKAQQEIIPCDFHYYVIASPWDQNKQKSLEAYFKIGGVRGIQLISSDSRYGRNFPFQLFEMAFMIAIVATLPLI
jgi:hypothetical protein